MKSFANLMSINEIRDERMDHWLNDFKKLEGKLEKIKQEFENIEKSSEFFDLVIWCNKTDEILPELKALEKRAEEYTHREERHRDSIDWIDKNNEQDPKNISIRLIYNWIYIWNTISNEIVELERIKKQLNEKAIQMQKAEKMKSISRELRGQNTENIGINSGHDDR